MPKPYDRLVIGSGSAGFNAARVAVSLGKRVAIVDSAPQLGGLCILKGCMQPKTLLYSTQILHLAQKAKTFGLRIPAATADMKTLHALADGRTLTAEKFLIATGSKVSVPSA